MPSQATESPRSVRTPRVLVQRIEATSSPDAARHPDAGTEVQDHLLLVIKAVVNGTCVPALVDSGATRSFVSDQLQTRPPLDFVGAYSSLELANGETIVSTGIAPDVLIGIGTAQSRLSLTAVPMMEGIQVILGRDWLNLVNPLVDWRTNSLVLRSGDRLEVVQGVHKDRSTQCQIRDQGLPGLQHAFVSLRDGASAQPSSNWGRQYAQLSSPQFWEPQTSARPWTRQDRPPSSCTDSPRRVDAPQGGVDAPMEPEDAVRHSAQDTSRGRRTRARKVSGRCVRQPVRRKLDFMTMRQAAKRANKTDLPMYLCAS